MTRPHKDLARGYTEQPEQLFNALAYAQTAVREVAGAYPGGVIQCEDAGGWLDLWYERRHLIGGCQIDLTFTISVSADKTMMRETNP